MNNSQHTEAGRKRLRTFLRNALLGGLGGLSGALFWTLSHQAAPSSLKKEKTGSTSSRQSAPGKTQSRSAQPGSGAEPHSPTSGGSTPEPPASRKGNPSTNSPILPKPSLPATINQSVDEGNESGTGQASTGISSTGVVQSVESGTVELDRRIKPSQKAPPSAANFQPATAEEEALRKQICPSISPRSSIAQLIARRQNPDMPSMLPRANLSCIQDASLLQRFPGHMFYVLRFPQWPLAMPLSPPLADNNIFVFDSKDIEEHITDSSGLKALFQRQMPAVADEKAAAQALVAWLRLAQELAQDGMYHFSIPQSSIDVKANGNEFVATGKALVDQHGGDTGDITATLVFSAGGKLKSARQSNNLQAGMRPICQSTRLLDLDPLVRRMAEQDLLIMGQRAKPYLEEQRKKVSPELQKAIDRIWQRILKEKR